MKRLLFFVILLLAPYSLLQAQELKRWTIGLNVSSGTQNLPEELTTWDDGYKLFPSVAYNFKPWLSVGAELHLPLQDRGLFSSTGAEFFVALRSPSLAGFRLTLAPVIGGSIIGAYKFSDKYSIGIDSYRGPSGSPAHDEAAMRELYARLGTLRYRWYVGLRPTLSYTISDKWSVSLSYSLLGYRSHSLLMQLYYPYDKEDFAFLKDEGAWGFTTQATYNSSLRLGVSYSF